MRRTCGDPEAAFRSHARQAEPESAPALRWCGVLIELAAELRRSAHGATRGELRSHAWTILSAAIHAGLRRQVRRYPGLSPDELDDIAAEKALQLLLRLETGSWDPSGRTRREVAAFVLSTARHGLQDRTAERRRTLTAGGEPAAPSPVSPVSGASDPAAALERREFAHALCRCLDRLAPRARRIWFLRVFCGLRSREIAALPEIRLRPDHIDVLLCRARNELSVAMRHLGFNPREIPPGTLTEVWLSLQGSTPALPVGGRVAAPRPGSPQE